MSHRPPQKNRAFQDTEEGTISIAKLLGVVIKPFLFSLNQVMRNPGIHQESGNSPTNNG